MTLITAKSYFFLRKAQEIKNLWDVPFAIERISSLHEVDTHWQTERHQCNTEINTRFPVN